MAFDLTNLTAALSALGSLVGLANKASTIEFNQKLIEVQKALLAIQEDFAKLLDENRRLKDELASEREYVFHHSVRWKKHPDGSEEGPFCPVCLSEGKTIFLRIRHRMQNGGLSFYCVHPHGKALSDQVYVLPEDLIPKDRYVIPT